MSECSVCHGLTVPDQMGLLSRCENQTDHAEIARLQAEVEQLHLQISRLDIEKADARQHAQEWERERDAALAQVALFARKHPCCTHASPSQARALLDRLQRAEAVVRAAEEFEVAWIDKVDRGLLILKVIALGDALAAYRERA